MYWQVDRLFWKEVDSTLDAETEVVFRLEECLFFNAGNRGVSNRFAIRFAPPAP